MFLITALFSGVMCVNNVYSALNNDVEMEEKTPKQRAQEIRERLADNPFFRPEPNKAIEAFEDLGMTYKQDPVTAALNKELQDKLVTALLNEILETDEARRYAIELMAGIINGGGPLLTTVLENAIKTISSINADNECSENDLAKAETYKALLDVKLNKMLNEVGFSQDSEEYVDLFALFDNIIFPNNDVLSKIQDEKKPQYEENKSRVTEALDELTINPILAKYDGVLDRDDLRGACIDVCNYLRIPASSSNVLEILRIFDECAQELPIEVVIDLKKLMYDYLLLIVDSMGEFKDYMKEMATYLKEKVIPEEREFLLRIVSIFNILLLLIWPPEMDLEIYFEFIEEYEENIRSIQNFEEFESFLIHSLKDMCKSKQIDKLTLKEYFDIIMKNYLLGEEGAKRIII